MKRGKKPNFTLAFNCGEFARIKPSTAFEHQRCGSKPAQGNALGWRITRAKALKGRNKTLNRLLRRPFRAGSVADPDLRALPWAGLLPGRWPSIAEFGIKPLEFESFRFSHDSNPIEFDGIRKQAGLNSFLESLNSVLIRQRLPAPERLLKLNEIAITQMRTLLTVSNVKRLK